jgi:hypothetical protein
LDRTREQHLEWCKQRAREYLDQGELLNAVTSMMSDLNKHPETRAQSASMTPLGLFAAMRAQEGDNDFVRRYVEGFR